MALNEAARALVDRFRDTTAIHAEVAALEAALEPALEADAPATEGGDTGDPEAQGGPGATDQPPAE